MTAALLLVAGVACSPGPERSVRDALEAVRAHDDLAFLDVVDTAALSGQLARDLIHWRRAQLPDETMVPQFAGLQEYLARGLMALVRGTRDSAWVDLRLLTALDSACLPATRVLQQRDRTARVELRCRSALYDADLRFPILLRKNDRDRWQIVGIDPWDGVVAQKDSLERVRLAAITAAVRDSLHTMTALASPVYIDTAASYGLAGPPRHVVTARTLVRNTGRVPLVGVTATIAATEVDTLPITLHLRAYHELEPGAVDTLTSTMWLLDDPFATHLPPSWLARLRTRPIAITRASYRLPGDTTLRRVEVPSSVREYRRM